MTEKLVRHEDRLFSRDPDLLAVARELYSRVSNAPIISPHGHVEAEMLAKNDNFKDPSDLLVRKDHYLTRVLHGAGVDLAELGLGTDDYDPKKAWRILADNWHLFLGTPTRYWLEDQMSLIFEVDRVLSSETADYIYDQINEKLTDEKFRPRQLLESFGVSYLATTDPPHSNLKWHKQLKDEGFSVRVAPTFRPDSLMDPCSASWKTQVQDFSSSIGVSLETYQDLKKQIKSRRMFFAMNGATSTDTGVADSRATPAPIQEIERIFKEALAGRPSDQDCKKFRENFLYDLIQMASVDGLVMQLHAGVKRNHHQETYQSFGPDTGHDLPLRTGFTSELEVALNEFGVGTNLRMVLFSVDSNAYGRDIAPLSGFYPSVYTGAPWWFLDHPDEILSLRKSTTPHAGFYKTSGFIDDTRALCSIPSRHDMSRRLDSSLLAEQVATKRISLNDAKKIADDLVSQIPTETFRLSNSFPMSSGDLGMAEAKKESSVKAGTEQTDNPANTTKEWR